MKRLRLLRHAKSSWDDPALADRDRPLAPRGRKGRETVQTVARRGGRTTGPRPVLAGTPGTADLRGCRPGMGSPPVLFEEALYHAPAGELLERVRLIGDDVAEVVLIGHNPGLAELCFCFRDRVRCTSGLRSISQPAHWRHWSSTWTAGLMLRRDAPADGSRLAARVELTGRVQPLGDTQSGSRRPPHRSP